MEPRIDLGAASPDEAPVSSEVIKKAQHLFRVNGCLWLENVFPADLIARMRDDFRTRYEILPGEEIEKKCLRVGHRRYKFTVSVKAPFNDPALYAAPRLLPILQAVMAPDCVIHSFGAVCAFPGSKIQHFHQDHGPLYIEAEGLNAFLPPYCVRVHIPMIDLDQSTGTTAMWAGSHRERSLDETKKLGDSVGEGTEGAYVPYLKTGDCYLMDFRLSHRGTANVSDRARTVLYILYSRRWFKDQKNFEQQSRLDVEAAEFEKIPEQHRHLFLNAMLTDH